MLTRYCLCGQPILVRFVKLATWRTFYLARVNGRFHGLTACPSCGGTLDIDALKCRRTGPAPLDPTIEGRLHESVPYLGHGHIAFQTEFVPAHGRDLNH